MRDGENKGMRRFYELQNIKNHKTKSQSALQHCQNNNNNDNNKNRYKGGSGV